MPKNIQLREHKEYTFVFLKKSAIDLENRLEVPLNKKILDDTTVIEMTSIIKDSILVINK